MSGPPVTAAHCPKVEKKKYIYGCMHQISTWSDASCVCPRLSDSCARRQDLPAVDAARQRDQQCIDLNIPPSSQCSRFKMAVHDGDEWKVMTDWTNAIPVTTGRH